MNKLLFVFILGVAQFALAQSYQLGKASLSGNGCKDSTASISTSPDLKSVSILFDDFSVDASGALGADRAFKTTCIVSIPVSITRGYTIETTTIDFRGFVDLDQNAIGSILTYATRTDYMNGPRFGRGKVIRGPLTDGVFSQSVVRPNPGNKKCPPVHYLYLAITAQVNTMSKTKQGFITLDSGDIGNNGVQMGVTLRPCQI